MTDVTGLQSRSPAGRDDYDFSVILGGPLFQMFRRAHLSGDALELLRRRIVIIAMFAWLPLVLLSILGGRAWGDAVQISFLKDIEVHARFLVALPLLIMAELVVHQRMRPAPVTKEPVVQLALITLVPVAPLVLTMVPLDDLLKKLLQVVL